ncbi:MAG: LacI family DNA-binding transcriptional regulator [Candidatus Abyssubacteria bacterium]
MRRATIKDVARRAKVSRATIDRVIYARGYVSEQKRKAVLEAIKTLNFTPNRAAQALAKKRKCAIAVIYPTAERYFWSEVEHGIDAAAREYENSGLIVIKRRIEKFDVEKQRKLLEQALNDGIDGVAFAPAHPSKLNPLISQLVDKHIPVVTFNHDAPDSVRLCYVGQNLLRSGELAADLMALFLRDRGKVAILRHRSGVLERESAFTRRMRQEYPKIDIVGHFNYRQSEERAYRLTHEICRDNPDLNGLYVTNVNVYVVGRAIKELRLRRKIRIVGFDMTEETKRLIKNGVIDAVIKQEPFRQGYEPIRILHDVLYKGERPRNPLVHTKSEIILKGNV